MRRRDFVGYCLLLVASLGFAYWATRPANDGDVDRVEIIKIDPKIVREVTYESAGEKVSIKLRPQTGAYWVRHETLTPVQGEPATIQEFRATERMKDVLASFNPLEALRTVGKASSDELEEYGLKDQPATLKIHSLDATLLELKIGKKSYGSSNIFALDNKDNRVLLLVGQYIDYISKAPAQLFERNLLSRPIEEYTRVVITRGDENVALVQAARDKEGGVQWRVDAESSTPKPSFRTWLEKVASLRIMSYADSSDLKQLEAADTRFELIFEHNGMPVDSLRFKTLSQNKGSDEVWVTSKFAMTDVKLGENRAEPVIKDLSTILSDAK